MREEGGVALETKKIALLPRILWALFVMLLFLVVSPLILVRFAFHPRTFLANIAASVKTAWLIALHKSPGEIMFITSLPRYRSSDDETEMMP